MELITITPSENKLWEQVWRLYNESFPDYERRRIGSHSLACEDDQFHTYIALDNGNLLALLFYWKKDDLIYIEHLAVNPNMRGRNVGSTILGGFIAENSSAQIVLEIDPPVDDISKRRLSFYERLGFVSTGRIFLHPSYRRNGTPHQLLVLSYPDALDAEQYEHFQQYVSEKVLRYRD